MITLYQVEWCPYCHRVREALTELELDYETINVPASRPARTEVIDLSGQEKVPIIKDGDLVVADSARIVEYLEETYGHAADREERDRHGESASLRTVRQTADPLCCPPSADGARGYGVGRPPPGSVGTGIV